MQALVGNVCLQYASMVSELLVMLHKTEQSLAKVRRNKAADVSAAAGAPEISNIQKISMQLLLDIKVCSLGHVQCAVMLLPCCLWRTQLTWLCTSGVVQLVVLLQCMDRLLIATTQMLCCAEAGVRQLHMCAGVWRTN